MRAPVAQRSWHRAVISLTLCLVSVRGLGADTVSAPRCPQAPQTPLAPLAPLAPLIPAAPPACVEHFHGRNTFKYTIRVTSSHSTNDSESSSAESVWIEWSGESRRLSVRCTDRVPLDEPALPRFERALSVRRLALSACVPARASYAHALAALNVTVRGAERLLLASLPNVTLNASHLTGLGAALASLELRAARAGTRLGDDALGALPHLRELRLERVAASAAALRALPATLESLRLDRAGAARLPADALRSLTALEVLSVTDDEPVTLPALPPALLDLGLDAPGEAPPALGHVRLANVSRLSAARPPPWADCARAERLGAVRWAARTLPADWVRACGGLRVLRVLHLSALRQLEPGALAGAASLRLLVLSHCRRLTHLPPDLFEGAPALEWLDLSANGLRMLPAELMAPFASAVSRLRLVDMSDNRLPGNATETLSFATSVTTLRLNNNRLGDLCPLLGSSSLAGLTRLVRLELAHTGARRVCPDWRRKLCALDALDLSHNDLELLRYADLAFCRASNSPVTLDLRSNPIDAVVYERSDYEAVLARAPSPPGQGVTVLLEGAGRGAAGGVRRCDCRWYWTLRALLERPAHVQLVNATCAAGDRTDVRRLECPTACAPPDRVWPAPGAVCSCAWAPRVGGLVARCTGLSALPPAAALALPSSPAPDPPLEGLVPELRELNASHGNISELRADLPPALVELDLSHNRVRGADARTAHSLLAGGRLVRLARNPLRCACRHRDTDDTNDTDHTGLALIGALTAHSGQVLDYDELTCADGTALSELSESSRRAECDGAEGGGPEGGASLVALSATLGAALAVTGLVFGLVRLRPHLLHRLKRALGVRGGAPAAELEPEAQRKAECEPEPEPEAQREAGCEYEYDVFVSYAQGDHAYVHEVLVPALEGALGLRACVHLRDWRPGEYIVAQIARSVRRSSRTLLVLSPHYAASHWAAAEFREALSASVGAGARPPLVLLLRDVSPGALPADLRAYLARNVYLRADDPLCWRKLGAALGPHADRAPADCPPADRAPADPSLPLSATMLLKQAPG